MTATVETVLPPDNPAELEPLSSLLAEISVPESVRKGLSAFMEALAQGSAVRVEPIAMLLSTTQAAALLNVSRMTLIKLLDEGKIPYERPRVHRLVHLGDVLAYKERRTKNRRAFMEESMAEAVEDGTFHVDSADYTSALRRARHRRQS
jgi:excisionase family DNA binding protein